MLDGTKNPATGLIWTPADLKLIRQSPARTIGWWLGKTKLQEMHDIWIRHIWANTPGADSSLMAHRGSYKTTAITEIGTIWNWLWNPDDRVAIVRETHTVSAETLATIAKHMEVPWLRSLFDFWHGKGTSEAVVNREGKVQYAFKKTVTKEGSGEAFGILRVPTGFHCDKVLGDDFVTKEDKYSRAKREKTCAAIQEIQTNIVDPGGECHWVGTPWHKDDAWTCVPRAVKFPRKKTGLLPDDKYEDVIYRTLEDGRKVRKISKSQEAANYDLEHVADEGMLFAELAHVQQWQNGLQDVVAHVDARFQGTHWTALTITARLPDGRIQITGHAWEKHIDDIEEEIDTLLVRYKVRKYTQERNPDKGYSLKRAVQRWESKRLRISVPRDRTGEYGYQEGTNKHNKIMSHLLSKWGILVWDTDCQEDYLDMVLNYREGEEPDDAPDSAASLLREFFDETKPQAGSDWRIR